MLDVGHRFFLNNLQPFSEYSMHGIVGDYRIGTHEAEIVPLLSSETVEIACYCWDSDYDVTPLTGIVKNSPPHTTPPTNIRLRNNRLELKQANLSGPNLSAVDNKTVLALSPCFEVNFCTDAFAAHLGILHLLQGRRFITLASGKQMTLFDTGEEGEPVLYLDRPDNDAPITSISAGQQTGLSEAYSTTVNIAHTVPEFIDGNAVASFTVLERYISYIMQRSLVPEEKNTIWTPLYAPISWGWSIRVERRSDGDWAITRRKLLLPTIDDAGLQLPLWKNNSIACSTALNHRD